jgi:hypothetical protein
MRHDNRFVGDQIRLLTALLGSFCPAAAVAMTTAIAATAATVAQQRTA